MKALIYIDQRAAMRAGIDAPSSTMRVDFTPELVKDSDILKMVADHLDFKTGEVAVPGIDKQALTFLQQPTPDQLLAGLRRMMWQWASLKSAPTELRDRYARAQSETLEVFQSRRTRTRKTYARVRRLPGGELENLIDDAPPSTEERAVSAVAFVIREPAWPEDVVESVIESEESAAWTAELEDANERATIQAFSEAKAQLQKMEAALATLHQQRADQEAREQEQLQDQRRKLVDWVKLHGSKLTQERLRRGWLSNEALREIVLRQRFRPFRHQPIEFIGVTRSVEDNVSNDSEMQAVLELERALTDAGMTSVRATIPIRSAPFPTRCLYATFDWPEFGIEGLGITFQLASLNWPAERIAKLIAFLEGYCEKEGIALEEAAQRFGIDAGKLWKLKEAREGEHDQEIVNKLREATLPLTDPHLFEIIPMPALRPAPSPKTAADASQPAGQERPSRISNR